MNKTKIKIIAGVLLVFFLGVVTGVLGTGIVIRHGIRKFTEQGPGNFFMKRLERELKLTDDQKKDVEKVIKDTEVEIHDLLKDSRKTFAASMEQRRLELRTLLQPEQQEQLDRMFERFHKRWPPLPHQ